ncbi:hypothetical protein ACT3T7_06320 [Halomonas sp. 111]
MQTASNTVSNTRGIQPLTAQEAQWLNRVIESEDLHVLFQPIADASQHSIYGYEGLIRGPKTPPLRLFDVAMQAGLLVELH